MKFFVNQPTRENAVAYCHNPKHVGYLSVAIIKERGCTQKNCRYFHKYANNPYWVQKKRVKRKAKFRHWLDNDDYVRISEYIAELIGEKYEQDNTSIT